MQTELKKIETFNTPQGMIDLSSPANILLDMMNKLATQPDLIPQAKAMCEISDQYIEIAKAQVSQGNLVLSIAKHNNFILDNQKP